MATIDEISSGNVKVLRLCGDLTYDGVAPLAGLMEAAIPGDGRVVIDLSGVPIITTPGISLLVAAARRTSACGGRLVVTGAYGVVDSVLRRCRLDDVLPLLKDSTEALRRASE